MNPRVWASLDDFLHPAAAGGWLGRNMANHYFISALFRYGTFDEYHFFLANSAHRRLFLESHAPLLSDLNMEDRVKVFERLDLPEQLKKNQYAVFHQSDHINHFNALCRLRDRMGAEVPITAFIHSISYQEFMPRYLEMCEGGPGPFDALICSSKGGRDALKKVFGRLGNREAPMQLPVVPLGIDEQRESPPREASRARLGVPPTETVGLGFGRFSEIDKMDLFPLLQAFRKGAAETPTNKLFLAGSVHSPSYMNMLEIWIDALGLRESVRIVTDPSEAVKRDLFAAADFFVSLADNPQETFGLTILEAMHAGLPLLVSDFDGYRELVTDDVGYRAPTIWHPAPELDALQPLMDERTYHLYAAQSIALDNDFVSDALEVLFGDPALRGRMGRAAQMRFSACYSHQSTIQRLEGLWDELRAGFQRKEAAPIDSLSLNTFETFSHYVSRSLQNDDCLVATSFGRQILSRNTSYPLLGNMAKLVDLEAMRDLLRRADSPTAFDVLQADAPGDAWRRRYLVLWMLKHGLLKIHSI